MTLHLDRADTPATLVLPAGPIPARMIEHAGCDLARRLGVDPARIVVAGPGMLPCGLVSFMTPIAA